MRRSSVVLSDDEVAAEVRKAHAGQPQDQIEDEVSKALSARAQLSEQAQAEYDRPKPSLTDPATRKWAEAEAKRLRDLAEAGKAKPTKPSQ